MKTFEKLYILANFILITIFVFVIFTSTTKNNSSLGGLPVYQQIATTTAVGPDLIKTIFSSTSNCQSRVITTASAPLHFTVGEPNNGNFSSTTLSLNNGHYQPSSTTQEYPSDIYGCGQWNALATASSTINTEQF